MDLNKDMRIEWETGKISIAKSLTNSLDGSNVRGHQVMAGSHACTFVYLSIRLIANR